jgi:hypothetical protein
MKDVPSVIAYHHIQPWLMGNLIHVDFDFNLERMEDVTVRLNTMLDRFENGDLKGYLFIFSLSLFESFFFFYIY